MAFFPLFVNLEGKYILVIGGGKIATRRVKALLGFGCKICVIAPEISEEMNVLVQDGAVEWRCKEYSGLNDIDAGDTKLVFVLASAVSEVNQAVVEDCRNAGIPVNDASCKENCDFYFPGLVTDGEVVVGITAGGSDHKFASELSANIRELVHDMKRKKSGTAE